MECCLCTAVCVLHTDKGPVCCTLPPRPRLHSCAQQQQQPQQRPRAGQRESVTISFFACHTAKPFF